MHFRKSPSLLFPPGGFAVQPLLYCTLKNEKSSVSKQTDTLRLQTFCFPLSVIFLEILQALQTNNGSSSIRTWQSTPKPRPLGRRNVDLILSLATTNNKKTRSTIRSFTHQAPTERTFRARQTSTSVLLQSLCKSSWEGVESPLPFQFCQAHPAAICTELKLTQVSGDKGMPWQCPLKARSPQRLFFQREGGIQKSPGEYSKLSNCQSMLNIPSL